MKKLTVIISAIYFYFIFTSPAFAAIVNLEGSGCLTGGSNQVATVNCFPIILGNIVLWLLTLAGIVAVFMIIISGFKFVTSAGDAKQAEGAKKSLTFSILGLVLIILSIIIMPIIIKLTGVNACVENFSFKECVPGDARRECLYDSDCPIPSQACRGGVCREI